MADHELVFVFVPWKKSKDCKFSCISPHQHWFFKELTFYYPILSTFMFRIVCLQTDPGLKRHQSIKFFCRRSQHFIHQTSWVAWRTMHSPLEIIYVE